MAATTILERSSQLKTSRVPFVHARVVLAERPTSARPGDEALVLGDGTLEGFVGGSCAESTVREQSLASLASGESRLIRITPRPEADQGGKVVVHNPCLSGGTLEIFLEPAVPPPLVTVYGVSPIAEALVDLGGRLGYDLRPLEGDIPSDTAAVVVAAHGRGDEEAVLTAALRAGVPYVGLVASPARGSAVVAALDVEPPERARVSTPAGLDIGARTAPEVALSILAEMIEQRGSRTRPTVSTAPGHRPPGITSEEPAVPHERPDVASDPAASAPGAVPTAIDPVCGMSVATVPASLHLELDGTTWWFCGPGCQHAFAAEPAAYGA